MTDYLLVGLGNPGSKYEQTRHNAGWLAIDQLAAYLKITFQLKASFEGFFAQAKYGEHRLYLLKPTTYMNLSGQSVRNVLNFYKIAPQNMLVIYDDINLDFGRLRLRSKGSAGSHKGMQSIIDCLGHHNFARLKIGIGPLPTKYILTHFVLEPFSSLEWKQLPFILDDTVKGIEAFLCHDIEKAMQICNAPAKWENTAK